MCQRKDIVSHLSFHLDFMTERCTVLGIVTVSSLWTWRWRHVAGSISSAFTLTVRSAFLLYSNRDPTSLPTDLKRQLSSIKEMKVFLSLWWQWFIQHFCEWSVEGCRVEFDLKWRLSFCSVKQWSGRAPHNFIEVNIWSGFTFVVSSLAGANPF